MKKNIIILFALIVVFGIQNQVFAVGPVECSNIDRCPQVKDEYNRNIYECGTVYVPNPPPDQYGLNMCINTGHRDCSPRGDGVRMPKSCGAGEICVIETHSGSTDPIPRGVCVVSAVSKGTTTTRPIGSPKPVEESAPACGRKFLDFIKSKPSKPSCDNLHVYSGGVCVVASQVGLLDSDIRDIYEKTVDEMKPNESTTIKGKMKNGNYFSVGILRGSDGSYSFTKDGVNYRDNLKDTINPGYFSRIKDWFNPAHPGGSYVGPDTAGENGKVNQTEGQMRLDASSITFSSLQKNSGNPDAREKIGMQAVDSSMKGAGNLLEGKYTDIVLAALKGLTGCDLPTLKKILDGKYSDIIFDKAALVRKLYTFPADSVITLAKELRTASFAKAASEYMKERDNYTPDKILELMNSGQLPEIDLASNIKGVGKDFAPPVLFSAYEEAYQRYLLTKKLTQ